MFVFLLPVKVKLLFSERLIIDAEMIYLNQHTECYNGPSKWDKTMDDLFQVLDVVINGFTLV